jgi:hypothetical membrane protein
MILIHIILFGLGLLGFLDGIYLIKASHKIRGWILLTAGIAAIVISVEQSLLYLFFNRPSTSVFVWSSKFMYNLSILILGILFFFMGIDSIKNGQLYQKIRGVFAVIIGAVMIFLNFFEILLG